MEAGLGSGEDVDVAVDEEEDKDVAFVATTTCNTFNSCSNLLSKLDIRASTSASLLGEEEEGMREV